VNALLLASTGPAKSRRGLAYWELSVRYFVGFGVEQNFEESARWLNKAALSNVKAALVYHSKLWSALGQDPSPLGKQPLETLETSSPIDPGFRTRRHHACHGGHSSAERRRR
jgi:TPR repeat protein